MKVRLSTLCVGGSILLAFACANCREDSSRDAAADSQASGHGQRPPNLARPREARKAEFTNARGHFIECWQRDGAAPLSEEAARELRDLMDAGINRWTRQDFKEVTSELASGDLGDPRRAAILYAVLERYSAIDPAAALALHEKLTATSLATIPALPSQLLLNLAGQDPWSAAAWLSEREAASSTLEGQVVMGIIVKAAAEQDPALALSILADLERLDADQATSSLADAGLTRDQKIHLIEELRKRAADPATEKLASLQAPLFQKLGAGFTGTPVEEIRRWAEAADLSPEELGHFATGFKPPRNPGEAQEWRTWLGASGIASP